jgi:hypothetical protein
MCKNVQVLGCLVQKYPLKSREIADLETKKPQNITFFD